MFKIKKLILPYFNYIINAGNAHSIHSPFVFQLYTEVIKSFKFYYVFYDIENIRRKLYTSQESIEVEDFGAGSKIHPSSRRKISLIARHSIAPSKQGQLLFKLVNYFQPDTIFELGTSLGISTLYLASANSQATVYTFEGCPQTTQVARQNFQQTGISNIQVNVGKLEDTLPPQLQKIKQLDFVFFDANHRYAPTMHYFEVCLEKAHENSVFVFDDIHWSPEMEKAWKEIQNHPQVTITIDLFQLGLVFFRKKQPSQHFILKF